MSNRDPLYDDSSQSGAWEATQNMNDQNLNAADKAKLKSDDVSAKTEEAANKAKDVVDQGKRKAEDVASKAQDGADEGLDKAANKMDDAADMIRQRGSEQGGTVGSVASTAADTMESASSFLHNTDTSEMMDQVEAYIRQNPTQSLLIAAGVGFVLAKAFK